MKWIYRLYIFFVGIILTTTVGFGIAAFYPQPVRPSYPYEFSRVVVPQSCYDTPQQQATEECQKIIANQEKEQQASVNIQQEHNKKIEAYDNVNAGYTRTAVFLGIAIGAFFAIFGIGLIRFSYPVSNGVILAGVLTAILTRFLIMLASLGSSVTGTNSADSFSYIQFGILAALSAAVLFVGFTMLDRKEVNPK